MNLRERNENRIIKSAIFELYDNGNEDAIKPVPFSTTYPASKHSEKSVEAFRMAVPNAEIYLLPAEVKGFEWLIEYNRTHDDKIVLVNMSATKSYSPWLEDDIAEHAFMMTSAGNDGDQGEAWSARQEFWCAIGAVDENLVPRDFSSWSYGDVVCVGIDNYLIPSMGVRYSQTSSVSPRILGLIAQWYIWYFAEFDCYPSINQTYDFIKMNSHDIFEDGPDLKTGYGYFRLPKKFTAEKIVVRAGERYAKKYYHVEGQEPTWKQIDLLIEPMIINDRTMVGSNGLTSNLAIKVHWDPIARESHYIRTVMECIQ